MIAGWLIEKEIRALFSLKRKKGDALMTGDFVLISDCAFCWVYDQSPTLARNGEDHGYIRMDKYLHWYEAFWV